MTSTINLICFKCKHYLDYAEGCRAFPEGIPDKILRTNQHNKPLKVQQNKLVYEYDDRMD